MTSHAEPASEPIVRKPRLWPAWIILAIQLVALILTITPSINNAARFGFMALGPAVCGTLFIIWLLFASRLPWRQRLILLLAPVLLCFAASVLIDPVMNVALLIYGAPFSLATIVLGIFVTRRDQEPTRRVAGIVTVLALIWGSFPLMRLDGFTGNYLPELAWRWSPTHEDALPDDDAPAGIGPTGWRPTQAEWPGFRGPQRNSRVASIAETALYWSASPPAELWRIPIGPAWSSFAYVAGRLFTQEQRGPEEWVTSYDAESGDLIWRRAENARFSEPVSGAGPRATPTFAEGRLYIYGARAMLSCLDAATGQLIWQRDLMEELGARLPVWGFSSSPLLTHGLVIVYADGEGDNGWVAFDAASGVPSWRINSEGMNFSSAQLADIDDQTLVLFAGADGLTAVEPATGALLWQFRPSEWSGPPICQAQQIGPDSVIVPLGDGVGLARLEIRRASGEWSIEERWTSRKLKPSFNDFVYHDGHLYGFDQSIFTSIDAETGERNWKSGRYGFGQVLLLEGQSQLLVTAEDGSVILLAADPQRHRELGRFQPMDGKTWNHPIVVKDRLYVRNGIEAVCLSLANSPSPNLSAPPG